ncbi:MAG: hypothetical protein V7K38_04160 [Nostoc sp.]|uniref:hypothetical protein n=1 Tax=Nostoc sp. TaxID=1180 RepID=UPI002FFB8E4C
MWRWRNRLPSAIASPVQLYNPRFPAMATGSGERLLGTRGISGGALWQAGAESVQWRVGVGDYCD